MTALSQSRARVAENRGHQDRQGEIDVALSTPMNGCAGAHVPLPVNGGSWLSVRPPRVRATNVEAEGLAARRREARRTRAAYTGKSRRRVRAPASSPDTGSCRNSRVRPRASRRTKLPIVERDRRGTSLKTSLPVSPTQPVVWGNTILWPQTSRHAKTRRQAGLYGDGDASDDRSRHQ